MSDKKAGDAATAVAEPMVEVINQGGATHTTSKGKLAPNCGIALPASEAKRMLAYTHIVRADSIVKSAGDSAALRKENADLKAMVKDLEAKVADFLGAASKKDLEALQDKHAPVEPVKAE